MDRHTHAFQVRPPSLVSQQCFAFLLFSYLITFFLLSLTTTLLVRSSMDLRAAERSVAMNHVFWVEESAADLAYRTLQTSEPPVLVVGACQQNFATVTLQGTTSTARLCLDAEEDAGPELRRTYRIETTGTSQSWSVPVERVEMRVELLFHRVQFPGVITTMETIFLNSMTINGPVVSTNAEPPVPILHLSNGDGPATLNGDILFPGGDEWKSPPMITGTGTWNGEYKDIDAWEPPQLQVPLGVVQLEDLVNPGNVVLEPGDYVVDNVELESEDQLLVTPQGARLYVRDSFQVWGGTVGIQGGVEGTPLLVALVADGQSPGPYLGLKKGNVTAMIYAPDSWLDITVDTPGLNFHGAMVIENASGPPLSQPSTLTYDQAVKGQWFPLGAGVVTSKAWLMSVAGPAPADEEGFQ